MPEGLLQFFCEIFSLGFEKVDEPVSLYLLIETIETKELMDKYGIKGDNDNDQLAKVGTRNGMCEYLVVAV